MSWGAICGLSLAQDDVLRFANGDQLHGKWLGMAAAEVLQWSSDDALVPQEWKTAQLRHVLRPQAMINGLTEMATVNLRDGDVLPGVVRQMDARELRVESPVLGVVTVPREQVREIQPAPYAGKLLYAGPFTADGWQSVSVGETEPAPPHGEAAAHWQHIGAAWYHVKGDQALRRENCLPDRAVLRFRLSWRERLSVNIVLNADFAPRVVADKEQKLEQPSFGNAWVLNLYQTYFSLNRTGYQRDGKPLDDRSQHAPSSVRLPENGEAEFEFRMDRERGMLLLYINGEYAAQWEQLEAQDERGEPVNQPLGSGFALHCPMAKMSLRFSDCVITQWNGMRDSAASRSNQDLDVVMMNNGLDRFAGQVLGVNEGTLRVATVYGELALKMADVASIHFAAGREPVKKTADAARLPGSCWLRFYPLGSLNVDALSGSVTGLQARHKVLGALSVRTASLLALEFDDDFIWQEPHDRPAMPKRDNPEEPQ